jgi:hypothetical protein
MKTNLFIVGAAKSATSYVYEILKNHPKIRMSEIKEPNFFCDDFDENVMSAYKWKTFKNLNKTLVKENQISTRHEALIRDCKVYNKLFETNKKSSDYLYFGEASINYFVSSTASKNIYRYNPNAKIIIILRNPFERIKSHFRMNLQIGEYETLNFNDELLINLARYENNPFSSYLSHSLYYKNIKRYYDLFERNQIFIFFQEDKTSFNSQLPKALSNFLNLDLLIDKQIIKKNTTKFLNNNFIVKLNKNSKLKYLIKKYANKRIKNYVKKKFLYSNKSNKIEKYHIPDDIKSILYKDIRKLEKLLNINLDYWND